MKTILEQNIQELNRFEKCLIAIQARESGEWDNPFLMEIGALSADTETDVVRISKHFGFNVARGL